MDRAPLRVLACADAGDLAASMAHHLQATLIASRDVWFACGEGKFVIDENIRGTDVYIVQQPIVPGSTRSIYDRTLMLMHAVDAARHSDAERVTVILPYLPGGRQDKRKGRTREGVSTSLFARMLEAAGASMLITVEPHNEAISGCFDPRKCVFEPVYVTHAFSHWLSSEGLVGDLVASTDVGGLQRARRFAHHLQRGLVAVSKERDYSVPNAVARSTVIGDVQGRSVTVFDDMIDTAGSAIAAIEALWAEGATDVTLATVHPLLSNPAWERLTALHDRAVARGSRFTLAGTSSVAHRSPPAWYRSFGLEPLLADVIRSVNARESVNVLLGEED
jgi:ribose-phosphate pyrophosphokinase